MVTAHPARSSLCFVDDIEALHAELGGKQYPFMNPGIEPHGVGREMEGLIVALLRSELPRSLFRLKS